MSTIAAALACVHLQELVRHSGPSWLEWAAKALFRKHQERFVRPLLLANSEKEAFAALGAHRLEYVASRVTSTMFVLALRPWDQLTAQLAQEFYEEMQRRLAKASLPDETSQKIDYVAYSFCQIGLASQKMVRSRGKGARSPMTLPDAKHVLSTTAAFDVLTSAAFTGASEPSSIKNLLVFSGLMDKAVQACDAYIALFAELGYIHN